MAKTTDQLVRILSAGGGIIIEADLKTTDQLIKLAAAAKTGKTTLTITKTFNKLTDQLVSIACSGKGHVVFDIR